ncbi:sigma factor-like helix-turn-helix DNA-binding protein [Alloscardovia omnicolens]|uniref:sigma factor-like helix-turn-helix DNA-binding protein n=1 Tax=Alloscardovia omnicolens TaxID=419015 RepID=UPI003A69FF59
MLSAKEYLRQAYRLDERIELEIEEIKALRELASSVSSICSDTGSIQTSKSIDAPFTRTLHKVFELEEDLCKKLETLCHLRQEMTQAIKDLANPNEQIVLQLRYLSNLSWGEIAIRLHADRTTVYRWHGRALQHFKIPDDAVII